MNRKTENNAFFSHNFSQTGEKNEKMERKSEKCRFIRIIKGLQIPIEESTEIPCGIWHERLRAGDLKKPPKNREIQLLL
ncbi:MAG: hypothetical protein K6F64_09710 [Clostridia bacterium]|nr:hypothetical protein [Clostridia bacterium]